MGKLGFGIIGTGAISKVHADCINQIENACLLGVVSSSPERAELAKETFDVPVYTEYKELLALKHLDVVCICTQSGKHLEPTIAAAQSGKHVLTEKPLEVALSRADKMIAACEKAGVKLGCIFQNRFSPDFLRLKNAVENGLLGRILMGNASINWFRSAEYYTESPWRGTLNGDGGAALINQGIHTIDLLLAVMGEVKWVKGRTKTLVHNIEGEDLAASLVEFKSGAIGTITGGTALTPGYPERLEVYGEKGSIILEAGKIIAWNVPDQTKSGSQTVLANKRSASDPTISNSDWHKAQFLDFIQAIQSNTTPAIDGVEARKSLELIKAIYDSSDSGNVVQL